MTVLLQKDGNLRVSLPYSKENTTAIHWVAGVDQKSVKWQEASKTWRVSIDRLDALLSIFGDIAEVAPNVFMAARPSLPVERFADMCAAGFVTLVVVGDHVHGFGGCWDTVLQDAIDAREVQLVRLLASGWQPPVVVAHVTPPAPANYDLLGELDYVMARGEHRWYEAAERKARIVEEAKQRRVKDQPLQPALLNL